MKTRHFPDAPPRIPRGLDYQGRHPEAAESATEIGVDDDSLSAACGIIRAAMWALAIWLVGIVTWMVVQ